MAKRLGLSEDIRLACQLQVTEDTQVRRLVLDETDLILTCRWHQSTFDIQTGEIREWVPALQENGV